ncbi:MAG: hypothetical protein WA090_05315 [Candidatus Nanopelagicaceae bacterium]
MNSSGNDLAPIDKSPKYADWPFYPRFIGALFTGGLVTMPISTKPGSLEGWPDAALQTLIEEGRRQLDDQMMSLERILSRAQLLFTTVLGLIALYGSTATEMWKNTDFNSRVLVVRLLLILSAVLLLLALLGAAALIANRKAYEGISAAVISRWEGFDLKKLAEDYAASVGPGDETNNAHLTVFGTAVRFTVSAAISLGFAWLVFHFRK